MESELKYELDTLRQTESELQQGRNRINEIRTMVQSETISVGKNSKLSLRIIDSMRCKVGRVFPMGFGPNSACGDIEITIGKTHPTLGKT